VIKNSKQLALTRKRIEEFSNAISKLEKEEPSFSPLLAKAQLDALIAQRDELIQNAEEYEQLLSGNLVVFDVSSLADLPKALIMARISMGLTQKELAERLGMKEQQIQRYENTEYSAASFKTLVSIVEALDLKVTEDVFLPKESREKNILLAKLSDAGLDKSFIEKRIAPRDVAPFEYGLWVEKTVEKLTSVFGWTSEQLLGDAPLVIGRDGSMLARFKMPVGANETYTSAYAQYAFTIANIIATHCTLDRKTIPQDYREVRKSILENHDGLTFETVLAYVTGLGIPVISLNDAGSLHGSLHGSFHAATWRLQGRNVIVLKQTSRHASRWMFDLLHELYHASQSPDKKEFAVIELSETSDERRNDQEEIDANQFAAKVLLGESAELYVEECFKHAKGKMEWLKNAVTQVADKYHLDCGVLAYQVANQIDNQLNSRAKNTGENVNWWGATNNVQTNTCEPGMLCFANLLSHFNIDRLNNHNRELIQQIASE